MSTQKLHETLDELHRQLESAEPIDEEARTHLRAAMEEVRQALERAERGETSRVEVPKEEEDGLLDRLRSWVEEFEQDHPTLSAGLADLIESLRRV